MLIPRIASMLLAARTDTAHRAGATRLAAIAWRTRTGWREPGRDRRQRQPHGFDGDHGRVVPDIARRLARARASGRRLRARQRRRRQRLPDHRRPDAHRRATRRAPRGVRARAAAVCSTRTDRASCLLAREGDASALARQLPLVSESLLVATGAPPPVWVNEAMVDLYGFTFGKTIELPLAGKATTFTVAGVWRDYARSQGAVVIERARYIALTDDRTATNAALWLAPGVDSREPRRGGRSRYSRRFAAGRRRARRNSRAVAQGVRPHLRGHVCTRTRRGRHRAVRIVVLVRRAGPGAPPRVRLAAPSRHDPTASRRDARGRGPGRQWHRPR